MDCSYEAGFATWQWYYEMIHQKPAPSFGEWMKLRDSVQKKDKAKEFISGSEEPLGLQEVNSRK